MLGPRERRSRLWRAEPMALVQLFIQLDAAHDTVDELGTLGIMQFRDVRARDADTPAPPLFWLTLTS